jgi:hypothetical protein
MENYICKSEVTYLAIRNAKSFASDPEFTRYTVLSSGGNVARSFATYLCCIEIPVEFTYVNQ